MTVQAHTSIIHPPPPPPPTKKIPEDEAFHETVTCEGNVFPFSRIWEFFSITIQGWMSSQQHYFITTQTSKSSKTCKI